MSDLLEVRLALDKWIRSHAAHLAHVGSWLVEWEAKCLMWQRLRDDYSTRWRDLIEQDAISHLDHPREHPDVQRMLEDSWDDNIQSETRDHGISPTKLERYFGVFKSEVGALMLGAFDLRNDFPRLDRIGMDVAEWADRVAVVDWLATDNDPRLVGAPDSDYPVPKGAYPFDSNLPPFRIGNDPYKASTRQNVGLALTNRPEFREDWPKMVSRVGKLIDKTDRTGKPDELDDLVTLNQAAAIVQMSKGSLKRYLHKGELPKPDIKGVGGQSNRRYWSNLRPSLQKHFRADLPKKFPSSRIASS